MDRAAMVVKAHDALKDIHSIARGFDTHESLFTHLDDDYVRLFINSHKGITAPLYQSCYEFKNAAMMGESAVKMKTRFASRGLSLGDQINEPPDHLAIELDTVWVLGDNFFKDCNIVSEYCPQRPGRPDLFYKYGLSLCPNKLQDPRRPDE